MYIGSGIGGGVGGGTMRKSFKDSLKGLEADIQHANTLAADFPREYDGACLQMRMSYSPAAHLFLFLVQWTDCHLAGALGLLRILIYKVYVDGTTTMSTHERKASIREFYAVIYPSLLQLQDGVTDLEDKRQKAVCLERYKRRDDEEHRQFSDIDIEREEECGICMEMNSKIVLPNCNHAMCMRCYREWYSRYLYCMTQQIQRLSLYYTRARLFLKFPLMFVCHDIVLVFAACFFFHMFMALGNMLLWKTCRLFDLYSARGQQVTRCFHVQV